MMNIRPRGGEQLNTSQEMNEPQEIETQDNNGELGENTEEGQNQTDDQADNELIGQSSQSQKVSDVVATEIIRGLVNKEGKWYYCLFSDGVRGYIHFKHRYAIPQQRRFPREFYVVK